jgi:hypothetical protein
MTECPPLSRRKLESVLGERLMSESCIEKKKVYDMWIQGGHVHPELFNAGCGTETDQNYVRELIQMEQIEPIQIIKYIGPLEMPLCTYMYCCASILRNRSKRSCSSKLGIFFPSYRSQPMRGKQPVCPGQDKSHTLPWPKPTRLRPSLRSSDSWVNRSFGSTPSIFGLSVAGRRVY